MKDITIVDNFINDEELEEVIDAINHSSWTYTSRSTKEEILFWYAEMIQEATLGKQMLTKIEKIFGKKYTIDRMYANGQTFGQDGSFHPDSFEENAYTLLIYVSPITEENVDIIGGFTQIKQGTNIINIQPYQKRALFFKSTLIHRGMAPSRICDMLRISFAIKVHEV